MTDKPIIFSAPMVHAMLAGRKTQTRRLLKLPTKTHSGGPIYERKDMGGWAATTIGGKGCFTVDRDGNRVPAPERPAIWHQTTGTTMALPFAPGDRLYVREAWRIKHDLDCTAPRDILPFQHRPIWFEADRDGPDYGKRTDFGRLRHGMHMPRWASRLTLTVTEVRVQRVQEISEEDARAEGFESYPPGRTAALQFHAIWNSLHGPDAWDANPWVVAVSFTVQRCNIDAVTHA